MNFELIKRKQRSRCMLKHIANDITKSFDLEQINWAGRAPKLQIYVAHALIFPVVVILFEKVS